MTRVSLVEHDPAWTDAFVLEAARIRVELGTALVAMHHIGSTAIPGIIAKPVIDMLAEVHSATAVAGPPPPRPPGLESVGRTPTDAYTSSTPSPSGRRSDRRSAPFSARMLPMPTPRGAHLVRGA
ncbi:MAG: GrpB family protein [Gemmatimonadetes bacterium]|nr:GrpB family protein [Gemmatimonadota bacterium]